MSAAGATQTRFIVAVPSGGVVDVAALLSRGNQRLYRQGRVYHVNVTSLPTVAGVTMPSSSARLRTVGNHWIARKAWDLAFRKWRESTVEERSNGSRAGRWNDFRVKMNGSDSSASYIKAQWNAPALANGEVNYTQMVPDDGGVIKELAFFGATADTYGMITEYDLIRDTDQDTPPAAAGTMAYSGLMNDLNDAQANTLQEQGDNPPYDAVNVGNNGAAAYWWVGNSDAVNRSSGMIPAVCGLIQFVHGAGDLGYFAIDVKSGKYKGVHAEAMV